MQLPIVIIKGKSYFLDARLKEVRNVNDPHDRASIYEVEYLFDENSGSQIIDIYARELMKPHIFKEG